MQNMIFRASIVAAILVAPAARASDAVSISFDGACNTLTLSAYHDSRSAELGGKHCPQGLGTGFTGSFKVGKAVGLGVRFLGDSAGYYLVLSTPIATGGTWTLTKSADGKTISQSGGTYSVSGAPNDALQSNPPITDEKFALGGKGKKIVTVSFDGFCNLETITLSGKGATMIETGDGCDENIGAGIASKIGGLGNTYGFGWTSSDARGAVNDLVFTEPFTTGGTVAVYYTTNGISQNVTGPITYTVETGAHIPKRTGLKPISSLFK